MKTFLLGWLLKGACEVTALDRIVGLVEGALVLALAFFLVSWVINK